MRLMLGTKENCATCSDSETCVDTEAKATLLIVAVYYGSYRRANKYLYKVVDRPFDMFNLHAFFF